MYSWKKQKQKQNNFGFSFQNRCTELKSGVNNKYDFVLPMYILKLYKKQHSYITACVLYFRFQLYELNQYSYVTNAI